MKKQPTGLKDDFGNDIYPGDTIEWTYIAHGVESKDENGNSYFMRCYSGGKMIYKEIKETQIIEYKIKKDFAGYFLDKPDGLGVFLTRDTIKCKNLSFSESK